MTEQDLLTDRIVDAAIEVHRHLGPGRLESAYEECLCQELAASGMQYKRQVTLPIQYKGHPVETGFRADIIVEEQVLIELKAVANFLPVHEAQILTFLKLSGHRRGLLMNFNVMSMKNGIRRFVV